MEEWLSNSELTTNEVLIFDPYQAFITNTAYKVAGSHSDTIVINSNLTSNEVGLVCGTTYRVRIL